MSFEEQTIESEGPVFLVYLFLDELQPGSVLLSFLQTLTGLVQSYTDHAGLAQTPKPVWDLTSSTL